MTRIHNVHAREIAAPAAAVGDILDTVGGPGDRLWATDIWAAEPVVFDRPLGVGADGGHGSIRYSVVDYEPGRRLVFRFTPGGGLSGTHRFELEELGPERCRLTHILEADASRWTRPFVPVLIGWHDAMVETALDRAELGATGSLERPTRIPLWLRLVNGMEIAIGRALGKVPYRGAATRT
jgi:Polyketide cyclase / dehydrase and lipid transport